MSDDKRIGRQFPTQTVVLDYSDTKGGEAALLYEQSTRRLMPWQKEQLDIILATDKDGCWKHIKYGWSIAVSSDRAADPDSPESERMIIKRVCNSGEAADPLILGPVGDDGIVGNVDHDRCCGDYPRLKKERGKYL